MINAALFFPADITQPTWNENSIELKIITGYEALLNVSYVNGYYSDMTIIINLLQSQNKTYVYDNNVF